MTLGLWFSLKVHGLQIGAPVIPVKYKGSKVGFGCFAIGPVLHHPSVICVVSHTYVGVHK